ncbi:MAG: leucine-rich repeat domain-containing protein, partial [Kiritimatiellae bacterium]|nr:leucine-rich repeat domain-containing protein [Kiritimatiellia bacterium]
MKVKIDGFVALIAVGTLTLGAWADTWRDPATGYTWTYSVKDGKAEMRKEGKWGDNLCVISPRPSGALVIPSTLGGCPVTSIGKYAFYGCDGLKSVTIPSSVTKIGYNAFSGTPFLDSQPNGMVVLGGGVLYKMKGSCPHSVMIPSNVTSIASGVFSQCKGLKSVTIPSSVTNIGRYAFSGCSGLTLISVDSSNP